MSESKHAAQCETDTAPGDSQTSPAKEKQFHSPNDDQETLETSSPSLTPSLKQTQTPIIVNAINTQQSQFQTSDSQDSEYRDQASINQESWNQQTRSKSQQQAIEVLSPNVDDSGQKCSEVLQSKSLQIENVTVTSNDLPQSKAAISPKSAADSVPSKFECKVINGASDTLSQTDWENWPLEQIDSRLQQEEIELRKLRDAVVRKSKIVEKLRALKFERINPPGSEVRMESFKMCDDDDEEDEQQGQTNGAKSENDFEERVFDSIGVAKCGRCGAKLPLDLEAIDAHIVECEAAHSIKSHAAISHAPSSTIAQTSIRNYLDRQSEKGGAFAEWLKIFHTEFYEGDFDAERDILADRYRSVWLEELHLLNERNDSVTNSGT